MKSLVALAVFLGLGLARFVDVPPCHWARGAVDSLSQGQPARPQATAFLAANAVQQVFEGLKCGDAGWSARFIQNPPSAFVEGRARLEGFELQNVRTQVSGNQATVRATLKVNLATQVISRTGEFRLAFTQEGWKVDYGSLSGLGLAIFPR